MKNQCRGILISAGVWLVPILCGCFPVETEKKIEAVEPFYTMENVVAEPSLSGYWGDGQWFFSKAGRSYDVFYTGDPKENNIQYRAYLFKLKGDLYLDLCPKSGLSRTHTVMYVSQVEPTLKLSRLKLVYEKLGAKPVNNVPDKLKHMGELLTATTAELQEFLPQAKTSGAFVELCNLKRDDAKKK